MRIVGVTPATGKNPGTQAYRLALRSVLIAVICGLIQSCAGTVRTVSGTEAAPAPTLAADDLALFERMQAEYALQAGNGAQAADRLAKAAVLSDDPKLSLSALRAALNAGRATAAQALLARWRQLQPDAPALTAYAAAVALAGGDSSGAHAAADALGNAAEGRRRLAEALRWLPSLERVLPFVETRVERGGDAEAWMHWAAFARDRRAPETAMRLAAIAVQRFPTDARVHAFRAALLRERDPAAAVADLERALELDPASTPVRMSLAHALDAAGNAARASSIVAGIRSASDESVNAAIAYAARAAQPELLRAGYRQLQALPGPHPPQRLILLGNVAEMVGAAAEAERWYRQVPVGPQYPQAQLRVAALRYSAGDAAAALSLLAQLRAGGLPGRDALVRSYLLEAEIRQRSEGIDAALRVHDAGLHMLADDAELMYARALLFAEAGRFEEMERDLRRMIDLDPSDADALNALGYTLVDRNLRLDEAAQLLARAERLAADSPALLDSLGWLAYRRGDLDTALTKLRAAHALLEDAEVAAHLGEVLWQKGEHEQAKAVWESARKLDPEHRVLRETMRRFQP